MSDEQAIQTNPLTLYEYEQEYLDLLDREVTDDPAFEQAFVARLADALEDRDQKRERVAQFFLFLESQRAQIKLQKQRLDRRDDLYEHAENRMYEYVGRVIKSLGRDSKGKYRKLQAASATMYLRALPDSLDILDDDLIPDEYKSVTVTMPYDLWLRLREQHPELQAEHALGIKAKDPVVDASMVKEAIKNGADIPGADLRMSGWDYSLVVKS